MVIHRVFWTKQKTQKNKRWADGFVSVNDRGNMKLMSETRQVLDSDFRTNASQLQVGDELEFERHLATIEELCVEGSSLELQENPLPSEERRRQQHVPSTSTPLLLQRRNAPQAPAPSSTVPLRAGVGRNLLRKSAPSINSGKFLSLHPTAEPEAVHTGFAGDWQPMAAARGGGGNGGNRVQGGKQQGGGGGDSGFDREGGGKFTPAYFRQMKRAKLFGVEDCEGDQSALSDQPPVTPRDSFGDNRGVLGWGPGSPHPAAQQQATRCAPMGGAGRAPHEASPGFDPAGVGSNDVLALMGLVDDPPAGEEKGPSQVFAPASLGRSAFDLDDCERSMGVELDRLGPQVGVGCGAEAASQHASYVSFPSRAPIRVARPQPAATPHKPSEPSPPQLPSSKHAPTERGNASGLYCAVYARKSLKVKRWTSGYVQCGARGLTLLSDEQKQVDSSSTRAAQVLYHAGPLCILRAYFPFHTICELASLRPVSTDIAPIAQLSVDDEVDFAHHIALIEKEASLPLDSPVPAPRPEEAPSAASRPENPLEPDAAAATPVHSWRSAGDGRNLWRGNQATPATELKAAGQAREAATSRWEENTFWADDDAEGFEPSHRRGAGEQAYGSGGQGGFFALRNASASGMPLQGAGVRSGWGQMSQSKQVAGGRTGPSSFSAPRAAPVGSGGTGWSPYGATSQSPAAAPSLRQEMKEHQDMDREVQQRTKAAAAARPQGSPSSQGSPGLLPSGGVRSSGAAAGILLSNTRQLAVQPASRRIVIPDKFRSFHDYRNAFVAALEEEVTLRLRDTAQSLFRSMHTLAGAVSVNCNCGSAAVLRTCQKDNQNKGRSFFTCGTRKCNYFKWADEAKSSTPAATAQCGNISIDTSLPPPDMRLLRQRSRLGVFKCEINAKQAYGKRQRAQQCGPRSLDNNSSFIVRLVDLDERRLPGTAKNDLWVVSTSAYFSEDSGSSVTVCRSVWFGLGSDGCIELTRMSGSSMSNYTEGQTVYCLMGPNIQGEWDMLENMRNVTPPSVPLLSFLISGTTTLPAAAGSGMLVPNMALKVDLSQVDVRQEVDRCVQKMRLNDDQAAVVRQIAHCLLNPEDTMPVVLVHGVFGSGKSTLLVSIVLFLVSVFKGVAGDEAKKPRILVSSATNVAIDNILMGLLDRGYDSFVRVGCLKRIAKPVLKYTLRETGNDDKLEKDSLKELNDMLKGTRDGTEIRQIKAAIAECQQGKLRDLKRTLGKKRVVGVTCASSGREVLAGQTFDICILDESSQFIEPLSLLPVSRFGCRLLIAAGDPMQLPPTLSSPSAAEACPQGGAASIQDLSKTLFSRLVNCGVVPTMLRTQYRCHPTIGSAASELFYSGCLVNGCSEELRNGLIKGIPPLLFVDTQGSAESRQDSGSFVNSEEARFCAWFVSSVVSKGLEASQVGIICAYKAQVDAIHSAFEGAEAKAGCSLSGVQVSTVDAFQGGERDIIIVSSCRTESLGFLKSHNRMNVAITRAKRHLVLVGCGRTLPTHGCWKQLIDRARMQPGLRGVVGARDLQMDGELELEEFARQNGGQSESEGEDEEVEAETKLSHVQDGDVKPSDSEDSDEVPWRPRTTADEAAGVEGASNAIDMAGDPAAGGDEPNAKRHRVFQVESSPEPSQEPSLDPAREAAPDDARSQVADSASQSVTLSLSAPASQTVKSQSSAQSNSKALIPSFNLGSGDSDSDDE